MLSRLQNAVTEVYKYNSLISIYLRTSVIANQRLEVARFFIPEYERVKTLLVEVTQYSMARCRFVVIDHL